MRISDWSSDVCSSDLDPAHVPAGIYARQALQALGLWDQVADRLAPAANVRAALALVDRGEVPAGIVYETDAAISPRVRIVDAFPDEATPPIVYPLAIVAGREDPKSAAQGKSVSTRVALGRRAILNKQKNIHN